MGKTPFADASLTKFVRQYKEAKKTQRLTEEDARRETARATAVEAKRAMTPTSTPDLHAMLVGADAERRVHGLPAHAMESFLLHVHLQINNPQAAHQNATPQEPMEHDLQSIPGHSQGDPAKGHCQEGRQ